MVGGDGSERDGELALVSGSHSDVDILDTITRDRTIETSPEDQPRQSGSIRISLALAVECCRAID
jgi:hypothetical protein